MTIEEMKVKKKEAGLTNAQVAELSGVPLSTVQKVFSKTTASPRYATLRAIERAFSSLDSPQESRPRRKVTYSDAPKALHVAEPEAAYAAKPPFMRKRQGEYTLEDYLAWPEDQRIELIDGVIYDMAAPTGIHQFIAAFIHTQLYNFKTQTGHPCVPMISPTDVQLDRDNKTIVQPDVFVVCRPELIRESYAQNGLKRIYGAPDFVIEVLSPSTRAKDMLIKGAKYRNAGVKEYWLVDPDKRLITVYLFDGENVDYQQYTFDDEVPVSVTGGECKILIRTLEDELAKILHPAEG